MNFTSDSIIKHLNNSDYPFLNANYDVAAARVSGFCSQDRWAIIFELLMSYPSSDGIGLMICAYGTGLKVSQGFATPALHNPFTWEKNLLSDELDEEEDENIDENVIPEIAQINIRGQIITIQTKDVARLKRAPEFDFDLLVHLVDMYGDELFSINDELSLYISRDLKKLVRFEVWDCWEDEDKAVWENDRLHIPVYTCGVEIISQILETKNFNLCSSRSAKNLGVDWTVFE
jgi:hypothetical protein